MIFPQIQFHSKVYKLNCSKYINIDMWTDEQIKGKILHKMTRMGKFSHSHTSIDNIPKGFPLEIRGRVKDMAKELKKEGILLSKPTSYGEEVSINSSFKDKIIFYINKFLEMD